MKTGEASTAAIAIGHADTEQNQGEYEQSRKSL